MGFVVIALALDSLGCETWNRHVEGINCVSLSLPTKSQPYHLANDLISLA